MADKGVKIMVCATCGGENVKRDAWAVWSVPDQIWELEGEPFDHAYCATATANAASKSGKKIR